MQDTPPQASGRGRWRQLLIHAAAVVVLAFVAFLVWAFLQPPCEPVSTDGTTMAFGKQYFVVSEESLRALGFPRPVVPREQNAAFLYLEAGELRRPMPMLSRAAPPGSPSPSGTPDYEAALEAARDGRWEPAGTDVAKWLDSNAAALETLHAAVRKPLCLFPVICAGDTDRWPGLESKPIRPCPAIDTLLKLGDLLAFEAARLAHAGDHGGATEQLLTYLRMIEHLGSDNAGGLISLTCSLIAWCRVNRLLHAMLPVLELDAAQLTRLAETLERLGNNPPDYMAGLHAARWHCLRSLDECERGYEFAEDRNIVTACRRVRVCLCSDWIRYGLNGFFDALERVAQMPPSEAFTPSVQAELWADLKTYGKAGDLFTPVMDRYHRNVVANEACLGVARVAVALLLHRARTGRLPSTLQELGPAQAAQLPNDPFTAKPFILNTSGAGLTIYSIGCDLQDDGGTPEADIVLKLK